MQGSASGIRNCGGRGGAIGRGTYEQRGSRRGRGHFSLLNTAMSNTTLQSGSTSRTDHFLGFSYRGSCQRGRDRRGGRGNSHLWIFLVDSDWFWDGGDRNSHLGESTAHYKGIWEVKLGNVCPFLEIRSLV